VLTDADQYYAQLFYAIAGATRTIELETYIYARDPLGVRVTEALCKAARRGVRTRVMVDGFGIGPEFSDLARRLSAAGVEVRIFHPLPWRLSQWPYALSHLPSWRKFWHLVNYLNQRNHRKMLLVDRHTCLLGSFNLTQKHYPVSAGGQGWRDTAIAVSGISHSAVQVAFEAVWRRWRAGQRRELGRRLRHDGYLLNFTRALRLDKRKRVLGLLRDAQTRIWITNAYFVPDPLLQKTLMDASRRGVDVCLLLPHRSDVRFIPWASRYFYERLLRAGCRIHEYQGGILHAKTLLVDQQALIGSSNLNQRSFLHDLELDYLSRQAETILALETAFAQDLAASQRMGMSALRNQGAVQRVLGFLVLLFFTYWV
jgi:cardiolipin synthase